MERHKRIRTVILAATEAVAASIPISPAQANVEPPDSGCSGYYVTPAKPSSGDWPHGQDLKFVNCTSADRFVNIVCHAWPTLDDDIVCWSLRVNAYTIV